jgi:hypothetical protein
LIFAIATLLVIAAEVTKVSFILELGGRATERQGDRATIITGVDAS